MVPACEQAPPAHALRHVAHFPLSSDALLCEPPGALIPVHGESPRQKISPRAAGRAEDVPSQYLYAKALPQPHTQAPAYTHSTAADQPRSMSSLESAYALQSACVSTPPTHASEKNGSSVPCPHALLRAAGARSRYKATQTDLLHTAQRKLPGVPSPYNARTCLFSRRSVIA